MRDEQPHLFDDRAEPADKVRNKAVDIPLSERPNPMIRVYGEYPIGARHCGDCVSLIVKHDHGSRRYFGCLKRGPMTGGPGTDHLAGWAACGLFVEDRE